MENPFVVDRPVASDDLCGREPALARLQEEADADRPAAAVGPRGAGLTSAARELGRRLGEGGRLVLIVDAGDLASAAEVAGLALNELEGGKRAPSGASDAASGGGEVPALLLAARERERLLHLVVDDPGRQDGLPGLEDLVAAARDEGLGLTVFTRAPVLEEELTTLAGEPAELGPVLEPAWMAHVLERFLRTDRWIGNDHVRWAVEAAGGLPRPTQLLFHFLWEEAGGDGRVGEEALARAHRRLLARSGPRFRLLLDGLTRNQRRLMHALARAEAPVRPYASDFVRRHGFASPSSVQRALSSLRASGLVEEREGGPALAHRVLGRWLRRPRVARLGTDEA